jgi:AraC-like DNA-binding protein
MQKKCHFQYVKVQDGMSVRVKHRYDHSVTFDWHHHPIYELTLSLNSHGWRFIGDHIAHFHAHDLVLVPPDMPHTWASKLPVDTTRSPLTVVIWFTREWALRMAETCPEYAGIQRLINKSNTGLSFPASAATSVESRLPELLSDSPRKRLHAVLDTLCELAEARTVKLATELNSKPKSTRESERLSRVLEMLHQRYTEPIRVEDVCSVANLSIRSLHRLLTRYLSEGFSDYVSKLRIGRASMLLLETDKPIGLIAEESGFSNLSNFNRQFRQARNMTPKDFRSFVTTHGRVPPSFS